jgi:hypothetical protein
VASYRSSIANQLSAFERHVDGFVRQSLNQGGQRIKQRMFREQLSKPQEAPAKAFGVKRRSGTLQRSLYTKPRKAEGAWVLEATLGKGGMAPYAEEHENRGRIRFLDLVAQEFRVILDGIRTGLEFLNQRVGQAPVSTTDVSAGSSTAGFGFRAIGERIRLQRGIRRERRGGSFGWSSIVKGS